MSQDDREEEEEDDGEEEVDSEAGTMPSSLPLIWRGPNPWWLSSRPAKDPAQASLVMDPTPGPPQLSATRVEVPTGPKEAGDAGAGSNYLQTPSPRPHSLVLGLPRPALANVPSSPSP